MNSLIATQLPAAAEATDGVNTQLLIVAGVGIALIVVLIAKFKFHPFLALDPGLRVRGPRRRRGTGEGHHQLRGRGGRRPEGSRPADRPRRHAGQAARRLRRRQQGGRHPAGQGHRKQAGLVHHARRRDHRPADVLRDRARPAAAGDRPGHPALQDAAHAHRHPGAGRPVRAARTRAAAPRPADRDQRRQGRTGHHPGPRHPGRHPHGHHLRPALLAPGSPVGARGRSRRGRRRRHRARCRHGGRQAPAKLHRHADDHSLPGGAHAAQGRHGHHLAGPQDSPGHPDRSSTSSASRSSP